MSKYDPEYHKNYRKFYIDNNICVYCRSATPVEGKRGCITCLKHSSEITKKGCNNLRKEVFAHYGGAVCNCCGETEPNFLALDHINNDGSEQRRKLFGSSQGGGYGIYRWIRNNDYPDGYQVLCHNCNMGKKINGGICPHKTKQTLTAT